MIKLKWVFPTRVHLLYTGVHCGGYILTINYTHIIYIIYYMLHITNILYILYLIINIIYILYICIMHIYIYIYMHDVHVIYIYMYQLYELNVYILYNEATDSSKVVIFILPRYRGLRYAYSTSTHMRNTSIT